MVRTYLPLRTWLWVCRCNSSNDSRHVPGQIQGLPVRRPFRYTSYRAECGSARTAFLRALPTHCRNIACTSRIRPLTGAKFRFVLIPVPRTVRVLCDVVGPRRCAIPTRLFVVYSCCHSCFSCWFRSSAPSRCLPTGSGRRHSFCRAPTDNG